MIDRNPKSHSEGIRLIGLALSLLRNPAHAASITPASELPQGMAFLLRVANGDDEPLRLAIRETGASEEELKGAAINFFEQISFGPGDDPYRLLGLNPWAPTEEIKEHYRLLIRLFHPDRGIARHRAAEEYAARINQSYTAIRKQSSGALDEPVFPRGPSGGATSSIEQRPGSFSAQMDFVPPQASPFSLDSLPIRLTPQRVWIAIATAAVLFVGSAYLANSGSSSVSDAAAPSASRTAPAVTSAPKTQAIAESSKLDRLLEELAQPVSSSPSPQQATTESGGSMTPSSPGIDSSSRAPRPDSLKKELVLHSVADGVAADPQEKK
jgi:hypothetical protein